MRPYLQNKSDETCNLNRGDCPSFPACTCIAGNIEHSTEELWVTLSGYLHCCSAGPQLRPLSTRARCQAAEKTPLSARPMSPQENPQRTNCQWKQMLVFKKKKGDFSPSLWSLLPSCPLSLPPSLSSLSPSFHPDRVSCGSFWPYTCCVAGDDLEFLITRVSHHPWLGYFSQVML